MKPIYSIRWRLVASYVFLALLTAGLMGILGLSLLQQYTRRQETDYLRANAVSVARRAEPLLQSGGYSAALNELAGTAAFLGNNRVRILNADQAVIADSGPRQLVDQFLWIVPPLPDDRHIERLIRTGTASSPVGMNEEIIVALTGPATAGTVLSEAEIEPNHLALNGASGEMTVGSLPSIVFFSGASTPAANLPVGDLTIDGQLPPGTEYIVGRRVSGVGGYRFVFDDSRRVAQWSDQPGAVGLDLIDGTPVPLPAGTTVLRRVTTTSRTIKQIEVRIERQSLTPEPLAAAVPPRSGRTVTVPIGDVAEPLGYVEMSGGPDLAAESLATTGRAFLLAALGAIVLAVVVGLGVSRSLTAPLRDLTIVTGSMSSGNLSARAAVQGQDEIGHLAHRFNQMAAQLEESFAALETERDTLRRFIADASHELRTPITALKNFNELLQGAAAEDDAARAEFLAEGAVQLERLQWVTDNLLNLSRLDAGLVTLELAAVPLNQLLEAVIGSAESKATRRGLTLSVEHPAEDLQLVCDRARIEVALSNLLENALKFTPPGGQVTVGAAAVFNADEVRAIRFWVADDGPGIPAVEQSRLFERFYRGTAGAGPPGAGLGLAIVKSIVQAHGGWVEVRSEPGAGSCFSFILPEPSEATNFKNWPSL